MTLIPLYSPYQQLNTPTSNIPPWDTENTRHWNCHCILFLVRTCVECHLQTEESEEDCVQKCIISKVVINSSTGMCFPCVSILSNSRDQKSLLLPYTWDATLWNQFIAKKNPVKFEVFLEKHLMVHTQLVQSARVQLTLCICPSPQITSSWWLYCLFSQHALLRELLTVGYVKFPHGSEIWRNADSGVPLDPSPPHQNTVCVHWTNARQ